jgi:hypothetical protein
MQAVLTPVFLLLPFHERDFLSRKCSPMIRTISASAFTCWTKLEETAIGLLREVRSQKFLTRSRRSTAFPTRPCQFPLAGECE